MKKILFILFIILGTSGIAQAQILSKLKAKAKIATDSSINRSTDKVVDRAVNKTFDNVTDKALDKVGGKLNNLFKKKNKKQPDSVPTAIVDSNSVAIKPKNQRR